MVWAIIKAPILRALGTSVRGVCVCVCVERASVPYIVARR